MSAVLELGATQKAGCPGVSMISTNRIVLRENDITCEKPKNQQYPTDVLRWEFKKNKHVTSLLELWRTLERPDGVSGRNNDLKDQTEFSVGTVDCSRSPARPAAQYRSRASVPWSQSTAPTVIQMRRH
jgi:hypothetical protein